MPTSPASDVMRCRSCGNEERASEGYPCDTCGTFMCLMCAFRGVVRCAACERERGGPGGAASGGTVRST